MATLTGFWDLDKKLEGGLKAGYLYIIAARPGMGKSMLALNMIDHICGTEQKTALLFSLELARKNYVERIMSLEGRVDYSKIREGRIQGEEWDRIIAAAEHMKDMNIVIDDFPELSIDGFREKCVDCKAKYKDLSAVFIDYLQLMITSKQCDSRKSELSDIICGLKQVAMDLSLPVIVLSQLPRTLEYRENRVPLLSDLDRMIGSDRDIDVVMFLYRDDYYDKDMENKHIAEIHVPKNNGGTRGVCKLASLPDIMKFVNVDDNGK
jgi:replicative DNA helicase